MTSFHPTLRNHPPASEVEHFFLSPGPPPVGSSVAGHLLEDCPVCGDLVAALWRGSTADEPPVPPPSAAASGDDESFDEIWARLLSRMREAQAHLAEERSEAQQLVPRLLAQPLERQRILIDNSERYQSWGVCELLLEGGWAERFKNPRRTERLARLAVAVSEHLCAERYGRKLTRDLRARCWVGLANGLRILGDFGEANAAMDEARELLAAGTGNPLERANWLDIGASLLNSERHFDAADHRIGLAIRIYHQAGQWHDLGCALIKRAAICQHLDEVERAILLGRAGLDLADPDRDASVVLGGSLNLIRALHHSSRHREALAELGRVRPAYVSSGDRTTLLRFQWLEGSIATALGRDEQAEGCFRETRDGFLQLEIVHDAAIVSLDLACLLARQGRNAEVCRLAAEMIPIFESRRTRTDTLAAFILLRQAAEREAVTEALLQRVRSSLEDAQA